MLRRLRLRADGRGEFKRTHAARAGVAKPFHRIETFGRAALGGKPGINQRIAELVRQRIGEQSGKTVKSDRWQIGEDIDAFAQRHGDGRHLNAAPGESGIILEGGEALAIF